MSIIEVENAKTVDDVWRLARAASARRKASMARSKPLAPMMLASPAKIQPMPFAGHGGDDDGRKIKYFKAPTVLPEPIQHDWHFVQYVLRGRRAEINSVGVVPKFTIKYIITMVAAHFDLEYIEIISERRTQRVVLPRQIAMWISYKNTTRSLPEIGRKFGDRDHTTILHAVRKIEKMIETNPNFAAHVREIVDKIQ